MFSSQIVKVVLQNMKSSNFGDSSISRVEIMHRTPSDSGVNKAKLTFPDMKQHYRKIYFTKVFDNCQIQSDSGWIKPRKTLTAVFSSKTFEFASTSGTLT